MKAMILAAGRGQRMAHLVADVPKPLLKVNGKPLIVYQIEALARAGLRDIVINHAYKGEQIVEALSDGSEFGVNIQYSPEPEGGLETAGGIYNALPLLGEAPFVVVNADIFTDFNYSTLPKRLDGLAHLVLVPSPDFHPNGDFSLIDNLVRPPYDQGLTFSGIGVYNPTLFSTCDGAKQPLKPLLDSGVAMGQITGELFSGQWLDVGTPERLEQAEAL